MTLYQGQREIQLLFLGRGHTQGDTIVYLPKERIVCSGNMTETQPAYMGDAMFDEWLKTLDALNRIGFHYGPARAWRALPRQGPDHCVSGYLRISWLNSELSKQGLCSRRQPKRST